jgi:hypothetical protein
VFGKLEYTIVYIIGFAMGVATLVSPSEPVQSVIGVIFTILYGLIITTAAIGALYGIYRPNYRIEMTALFGLATGLAMYDIALIGIYVERVLSPETGIPSYGPPLIVAATTLLIIVKAHYLYVKNKELITTVEATKNATR